MVIKGMVKCPSCGAMNENEHLVDFLTCRACGCSIDDKGL